MLRVLLFLMLGATVVPVQLTFAAVSTELRRFDLLVYGGTPGGIACAVRAAREGLDVLLVSPETHLGGLLANGLTTMDTLYNGARAPLYDELRQGIHDYYRDRYGEDSEQYRRSLPGRPKTKYEAHVLERLLDRMVLAESRITLLKAYYPTAAERSGVELRRVTFRERTSDRSFSVTAAVFSDCSYEGDLLAVAKVPYRWGREARDEFNEEHAGKIFMRPLPWPPTGVAAEELARFRGLNIVQYDRHYEIVRPQSTGVADQSVQGYNLRTIITCNPSNRLPAGKPANYDREEIIRRLKTDLHWSTRVPSVGAPNQKAYLNLPQIVGSQHAYVEGDWSVRQKVIDAHANITRALLYFMQNDETVEETTRAGWREWGLARDEFPDNGHLPYEIYARETRRLVGRYIFTENDARYTPGLRRAPVHADSISITEWFLDSHACTPERVPGGNWEGQILLYNITVPGQIPYRALLAQGLDNLLVPGCVSSTHIGWGAIRLEPTWMSIAEAAAHATTIALRQKKQPAGINADELVRLLAERGVLVTFFNDIEVNPREPWYAAVQYFGTQGFFGTFDAQPLGALTVPLAEVWAQAMVEWLRGTPVDRTERARRMLIAEDRKGAPMVVQDFAEMLTRACKSASLEVPVARLVEEIQVARDLRISRGTACRLMYAAGRKPSK
jgi:hypothetical protein